MIFYKHKALAMTYAQMIDKLRSGEQFSFSRWGDGEWNAVLGRSGENCDGHKYFADMGARLKAILESQPDYYLGMQPMALRLNQEDAEFNRLMQLNEWCDAEILYKQVIGDGLDELFKALDGKRVLIIGPSHLNQLYSKLLVKDRHLIVPSKNVWMHYDTIKSMIEMRLDILNIDVILYACGMMSGVLIDDFKDAGVTQIDIGSAFDPLCGVYSRGAYRKLHEQGKL
jgi:hypothetical protein